MNSNDNRGRDPLDIIEERILVAIPRGDEELRVTFTRARKPDGSETAWHSIRVFWKTDDGQWRPGKQGITVRARELRAVADALSKAPSGGPPQRATAPSEPAADASRGDDDIPF